jgi:hypothetical protein
LRDATAALNETQRMKTDAAVNKSVTTALPTMYAAHAGWYHNPPLP